MPADHHADAGRRDHQRRAAAAATTRAISDQHERRQHESADGAFDGLLRAEAWRQRAAAKRAPCVELPVSLATTVASSSSTPRARPSAWMATSAPSGRPM